MAHALLARGEITGIFLEMPSTIIPFSFRTTIAIEAELALREKLPSQLIRNMLELSELGGLEGGEEDLSIIRC